MKRNTILFALAALALVGGLAWMSRRAKPGPTTGEPAAKLTSSAVTPAPAPSPAPPPPPAEPAESLLRGKVVDSAGKPVAGARAVATRRAAIGLEHLADPALRREWPAGAPATTDEAGAFEMRVEPGPPHDLSVSAAGFASTVVASVRGGESVSIVVRRGASVSGRVTRVEDDVPVAGARIVVARPGFDVPMWEGTTDDDGRYAADGIDVGQNELDVIPVEECRERSLVDLKEGESLVRDLRVSLGVIVTGVVTEKETGQPIEGAEIGTGVFPSKAARTDAQGHYVLPGLYATSLQGLTVRAAGFGGSEASLQPGNDRILRADFALSRGRSVAGRLVRADGSPVAGAYVAALARSYDHGVPRSDRVSTRSDAEGRFQLTGLRRDMTHALVVHEESLATRVVRALEEHPDDEIQLGDLALVPGASVSGRVLWLDRSPIPDVWIDLATTDPLQSDPNVGLGRLSLRTDREGRFYCQSIAPGRHVLRVLVSGLESEEILQLDFAEGEARRDVDVVVGRGRMIAGRVLDPDGQGVGDVDLLLRRAGEEAFRKALTDSDGRFRFGDLSPDAAYDLTASPIPSASPGGRELADVAVQGIPVGKTDVEIRLLRAAPITGRVLTPDGRAIGFALVVAVDAAGKRLDGRNADAEGRFRLRVPTDATVELRAFKIGQDPKTGRGMWADESSLPQATQAGVRAGELEIDLVTMP